ncbi:uncharacterized protein LOC106662379 [Cimex lectularius]|uniref:Uncharacterized protein n=1 Tax=Cimex lectularius TaxID=79782 RepID=A0A8I6R9X3_CIMLE|nr:uncharacterized protein LOC106662379 [Cimex lectularius]
MELDEDLREILNEFEQWKQVGAKTAEKLRAKEKLVSSMESKVKFYQNEISYLKTQIEKKDEHLEQYRNIVQHFNSIDDKYSALLKEKEALDSEIAKIKKERECDLNAWNLEKQSFLKAGPTTVFSDKTLTKQVEELKAELHKVKEESKARFNYEQHQHRNDVNYYKQALSTNSEKYEKTIGKLNEDLAAAQLEIKNLQQNGSNKAMKSSQCHTVPVPVVTIQSIGVSSTSEIASSISKQVEIHKQVQKERVKFPSVKKRKLFNPKEDVLILN